jgi:hypothetical protein
MRSFQADRNSCPESSNNCVFCGAVLPSSFKNLDEATVAELRERKVAVKGTVLKTVLL